MQALGLKNESITGKDKRYISAVPAVKQTVWNIPVFVSLHRKKKERKQFCRITTLSRQADI